MLRGGCRSCPLLFCNCNLWGRALLPLGGVAIGRGNTSPVGKLPVLQLVGFSPRAWAVEELAGPSLAVGGERTSD